MQNHCRVAKKEEYVGLQRNPVKDKNQLLSMNIRVTILFLRKSGTTFPAKSMALLQAEAGAPGIVQWGGRVTRCARQKGG